MSLEDKKRDRALQRRVRERQAKTGESYQAAWQQITSSHDAPPTRRVPLALSTSVKILPGQSAQLTARPQVWTFWPERLLIKNAERWDIHQLTVWADGLTDAQLYEKGANANEEKPKAFLVENDSCDASVFALDAWHPLPPHEVHCGERIVLVVTYTGPNEQGECFEATLFGWEGSPPTKESMRPNASSSERVRERAESKAVRRNETIKLPLIITTPALFVDHLTIANAKDWIVNDVQACGKSIFLQAGELPGEMFSNSAAVILEPLAENDRVEVVATYVGSSESACLVVELSGARKPESGRRATSYFLPMSTKGYPLISPTQSAQITARPVKDFLPERLVIADQDAWIVNDIKIGNMSQFVQSGDLPGQSFASCAVGSHVVLDPALRAQDFVMVVTRGEDCKESAHFFCGVQGRLVEHSSDRAIVKTAYGPHASKPHGEDHNRDPHR